MADLDEQLDGLTDDEMLDAINRRAQRKAAAGDAAREDRRQARRKESNEHLRSEVKRRFGKDLPTDDAISSVTQGQEPTGGRAEAARRFPKGK